MAGLPNAGEGLGPECQRSFRFAGSECNRCWAWAVLMGICLCSASPLPRGRHRAQALGELSFAPRLCEESTPSVIQKEKLRWAATDPGRPIVPWADKRDVVEA